MPFSDLDLVDAIREVFEKQPPLAIVGVLMVLDIASGWVAAGIEGKLNSKTGTAGMMRKVMTMILLGMAAAVERAQPDVPLLKMSCFFIMCTEGLSILENAKRAGIPIPTILTKAMSNVKRELTDEDAAQLSGEVHIEAELHRKKKKPE